MAFGEQILVNTLDSNFDPQTQGTLFYNVFPQGIYSGLELSVVDSSTAEISPGDSVVHDTTNDLAIKHRQETAYQISVNETSPYIVARWEYNQTEDNPVEFVLTDTLQDRETVLGKCEFDGSGNLTGFDLRERVERDLDTIYRRNINTLRPSLTDPLSLSIKVRGDRYTISDNSETIEIPTQEVGPFDVPSSDPRIDLVTLTDDSGILIVEGAEGGGVPAYPSTATVLAEVKLSPDTTEIDKVVSDLTNFDEGIRDVRPFLNLGGAGETGTLGVDQQQVFSSISDGQTTVTPSFTIADDGSDIFVWLNGSKREYGTGYDYTVNSSNEIVFNYDLESGDRVTVAKFASESVSSHASTHFEGNSDPLDAAQLVNVDVSAIADTVVQRDASGGINIDDLNAVSGDFSGSAPTHPDATASNESATLGQAMGIDNMAQFEHREPSGTDGGSISADTWTTRPLTDEVINNISGVSLNNNQITISETGEYYIEGQGSLQGVGSRTQTRFQDITNSTTAVTGPSIDGASTSSSNNPELRGLFSVSGSTDYEIQHVSIESKTGNGLGVNAGGHLSVTIQHELYAIIRIWRVS